MSKDSYKSLIELQADYKSFENMLETHKNNRNKVFFKVRTNVISEMEFKEELLKLKTENVDLLEYISKLEKRSLDFYQKNNVDDIKTQTSILSLTEIPKLKRKLEIEEAEHKLIKNKYDSLEKNIQNDHAKITASYIVFIIWSCISILFFYVCAKIYLTNEVPSLTFVLIFILVCYAIYHIYINIHKYITIPNFN